MDCAELNWITLTPMAVLSAVPLALVGSMKLADGMRVAVVICRTALSAENVVLITAELAECGIVGRPNFEIIPSGNAKNAELPLRFGLTKLRKSVLLKVMDSAMNAAI